MGNETFYGDGLSKREHPRHTSKHKHKQQNEHAYLSYMYAVLTCAYYADALVRTSLYLNNNDS